jgi:anti-sigma factor RsiW
MSQACPGWRGDIGAYVVGALDREAGARVRRHLSACASCRADYGDLVPVRDWLGRLDPVSGGPAAHEPRPPLGPVRPRRRRRWLAAAAAAAGVAAAAALLTQLTAHPAGPGFQAFDTATGVHGQAQLHATATGTQIELTVSGVPAGERCTLVAVSPAGTDVAGSWSVGYNGTAHITGTSAIPAGRLTALRVETPTGTLLLRIHV